MTAICEICEEEQDDTSVLGRLITMYDPSRDECGTVHEDCGDQAGWKAAP